MPVPHERIRLLRTDPVRRDASYVLYWMTALRRLDWNFALDRAIEIAHEVGRPLVVFEPLRIGYRWASDRHHAFVLDGMRENAAKAAGSPIRYVPFVERAPEEGRGLLAALSEHACTVVTDEYPAFFLPRMLQKAATAVSARLEVVDSNGLLPHSVPGRTFTAAYHFRRFLQKTLGDRITLFPDPEPLNDPGLRRLEALPEVIRDRWPSLGAASLQMRPAELPIDHSVGPTAARGGSTEARTRLRAFLDRGLHRYLEDRNQPDSDGASGLSPWLHFGHISAHEIFHEVARAEGWSPARISGVANGKRAGWWGMSEGAEEFLDQLCTWRELGFVHCREVPDYDRYETLPDWARATLAEHASDPRDPTYTLQEFEGAETYDPLWNAAQRQLAEDGVIHNYLRMLWGKKILEWSRTPREALEIMIELNNRYALDGRDPNSYSGIFWTLGRFDRGWPERAIYGKVRSMSSDSTRRKVRLDDYLDRWGPTS